MSNFIDLRSDTVTLPTREMREAIKSARLGDDVYREDPTVNRLERMAAEKMGKEEALLVTSGTQANLISIMANTTRGDSVILEADSHIYWYEVGGISAIGGLFPIPVKGKLGILNPLEVQAAIRPENPHFPKTTLICIENTHNRAGGTIITPDQIEAICDTAKENHLKVYMDGARIFNAAVAMKVNVKEFTKNVDNLMFCLSKGLSCPVGSLIVGNRLFINKARKIRKVLGGGMRQAGIIAAPGIYALEHMTERLEDDHKNAKFLAGKLVEIDSISVDLNTVQTNMVLFDINALGITAEDFVLKLKKRGILALPRGKTMIRMVTHRGIEREHIEKVYQTIKCIVHNK